jgi:hypothetical protein
MFRGKYNQSLGFCLADLAAPTTPPADFVVEPEVEKKKETEAKSVRQPSASKKSTVESVDNFDKVEEYVDTIDLYDDDEDEKEKNKEKEQKEGISI